MSSPNPSCQVKDGGGAYGPTTNGVNVTSSDTITINLISSAGVNTWSISCIGTDELSNAATVTSSLTIDPVAKTATFTAPAAGRAYIFQSRVNSGVSVDSTTQSSYTTTFGIYTLTTASRRVHAINETFEGDPVFGWISSYNDLIRNPTNLTTPTGTGIPHIVGGSYQAASSLIVNADVDAAAAIAASKLGATGTNGNIVRQAAGVMGLGSIDLSLAAAVSTSKLGPANGGTGQDFSASTGVPVFNSGVGSNVAPGTAGNVLTSAGGAWTSAAPNFTPAFRTASASGSITSADLNGIVNVDSSGGSRTFGLPSPSAGFNFRIKDAKGTAGANNISLTQHAAEKIEGLAATKTFSTNWGSWLIWSDGTDWFVG